MLRNSTVLVILLLIVFLVMVSYVQDLKANVAKVASRIETVSETKPGTNNPNMNPNTAMMGGGISTTTIMNNNEHVTDPDALLDASTGSTMIPMEPSKLLSITNTGDDPIPLPVSGRFFESGEFHMVGHLTRIRNVRNTNNHGSFSSTTLPLYGQRIPSTKLSWVYAVIAQDARKYTVHIEMPSGDYVDCAKSPHGCRQLVSGDLVSVPGLDDHSLWRAKMFSKL